MGHPDVDYKDTIGRAVIKSSTYGQNSETVKTVEVAHIEPGRKGLMTVYWRKDDSPGGGVVSHGVHSIEFIRSDNGRF